jgi:hypothetical protein
MLFRYTAQFPQGVLQAGTETLEALAETDRHVLPIRVGQHEVIHHVRKRHASDRHLQSRQVGEVRSPEPAGMMSLGKEHFLVRSFQRSPTLDPSLERSQLTILKLARKTTLQVLEQGLRFQARG